MVTIRSDHNIMNDKNTFTLKLPVQALQYLRIAVGVIDLPLLDLPKQINQDDLDSGQRWLIEQKLIQKEKQGVGIDPLAIAAVQWMADPDRIVVYRYMEKSGNDQKGILYCLHDKELMVLHKDNTYNLIFFERSGLGYDHLCSFWKLKAAKEYPVNLPVLPLPESAIPLAWRDPKLFQQVMGEWGIPDKSAKELLTFLQASVGFLVSSEFSFIDGSPQLQKDTVCGMSADV